MRLVDSPLIFFVSVISSGGGGGGGLEGDADAAPLEDINEELS